MSTDPVSRLFPSAPELERRIRQHGYAATARYYAKRGIGSPELFVWLARGLMPKAP